MSTVTAALNRLLRGRDDSRVRATLRGLAGPVVGVAVVLVGLTAVRFAARTVLADALSGTGLNQSAVWQLLSGVVVAVATVAVLAVATRLDCRPIREYGLGLASRDRRDLGGGLLVGFLMAALPLAVLLALGEAAVTDTVSGTGADPALEFVGLALVVLGLTANVVYEEVAFRAVALRNFAEGLAARFGSPRRMVLVALVPHAAVFGLWHVVFSGGGGVEGRSLALVVSSAVFGGVWAAGYVLTGRLSLSIGVHVGYNLTHAFVFAPESVAITAPALARVSLSGAAATGSVAGVGSRGLVALCGILAWVSLTRGRIAVDETLATAGGDGSADQPGSPTGATATDD